MARVGLLASIAPDVTAFRRSRDYRIIELGAIVAGLGNQAALVAVPFQVYALTRSAALVGLIGAAELGPLVAVYLFGGALADRMDRRRILAAAQVGTAISAGTLAVLAFAGPPPVWTVFNLAALLAASGSLDLLSRQAMVVSLSGDWLRSAIAFAFAMSELVAIAGPGLGGVLIGAAGVGWVYAVDAAGVVVTLYAVATIGPQLPTGGGHHGSLVTSVAEGLRHVRSSRALLGSFAIDLFAMTFGMPRALFVVLSVHVYHAGAAGTGLLYASVSLGAGIAAVTNGWLTRARRLGRITIAMVLIWGRRSRSPASRRASRSPRCCWPSPAPPTACRRCAARRSRSWYRRRRRAGGSAPCSASSSPAACAWATSSPAASPH
jgi:MFS family permease